MKSYSIFCLSLLMGGVLLCCQEKTVYENDVRLMTELQCEARRLKEERFSIANALRFRNDSLTKLNIPLTNVQKQEEDSIKTTLTIRTGELAERLTRSMDSLFAVHYKTVEERQQFDAAVEKKLGEVCQ